MTALPRLRCDVVGCPHPARWKISICRHDKGERTTHLCGAHSRVLRIGPKVTDFYSVLSVAELEYVGRWST